MLPGGQLTMAFFARATSLLRTRSKHVAFAVNQPIVYSCRHPDIQYTSGKGWRTRALETQRATMEETQ